MIIFCRLLIFSAQLKYKKYHFIKLTLKQFTSPFPTLWMIQGAPYILHFHKINIPQTSTKIPNTVWLIKFSNTSQQWLKLSLNHIW